MATNFEFYKDEILKINDTHDHVAVENGKPISCNGIHCSHCELSKHPSCMDCRMKFIEWLYAEHIDPPKLTNRERAFCESVQTGWIVNYNGTKYWTDIEPIGSRFHADSHIAVMKNFGLDFNCVEEHKCLSIEDMLKLEVEE